MQSAFSILTRITFRHDYFASGAIRNFKVAPVKGSMDSRLIVKYLPDGFLLLFESSFNGRPVPKESITADGKDLYLLMQLQDPYFYNYTELRPFDISMNVFFFENNADNYSTTGLPCLHSKKHVNNACLKEAETYSSMFREKPFGLIHLTLNKDLQPEYEIRFAAKKTFWKYILSENYLDDLESPFIINGEAKEVFSAPEKITLPDQRKALAFTSVEKIALSEFSKKRYQLVSNYKSRHERQKTIIKTLPVPDIQTISRTSDENLTRNISEIFIY